MSSSGSGEGKSVVDGSVGIVAVLEYSVLSREEAVLVEALSLDVGLGRRVSGYSSSKRWIIPSRVVSKNLRRPDLVSISLR